MLHSVLLRDFLSNNEPEASSLQMLKVLARVQAPICHIEGIGDAVLLFDRLHRSLKVAILRLITRVQLEIERNAPLIDDPNSLIFI